MSNSLNKPATAAALTLEESMYSCVGELTAFWLGCIGYYGCDCVECVADEVAGMYANRTYDRFGIYAPLDKETALEVSFDRDDSHLRDLEYWDWDAARDAREVANDEAEFVKAEFLAAG